ncbi:hypothetical protein [Corallococcus exiguus]|uniref:hypothetical protein n=1 Tax=Corallococcus exiguus TaxID=83462 RepID=UPI001493FC9A|nr:hypothetical protein [Corallococcus exiguus]NPD28919.1 hypothetical protein [Corallococcus exiguus]
MSQHGNRHNHWFSGRTCAAWAGRLPPGAGPERLLGMARAILEAGAREQVWRVLETPGAHAFRAAPGFTYADHLERLWREQGLLLLLPGSHGAAPTEAGVWRAAARLAWLDEDDTVHEGDVEDVGLLLRRLRPDHAEDAERYMARVPPVSLWAPLPRSGVAAGGPLTVHLELETDIWFPRVVGMMEDEYADDLPPEADGLYDNRALAERHTPRLNRFIDAVREQVLAEGGAWSTAETTMPRYAPMYDEQGIHL